MECLEERKRVDRVRWNKERGWINEISIPVNAVSTEWQRWRSEWEERVCSINQSTSDMSGFEMGGDGWDTCFTINRLSPSLTWWQCCSSLDKWLTWMMWEWTECGNGVDREESGCDESGVVLDSSILRNRFHYRKQGSENEAIQNYDTWIAT